MKKLLDREYELQNRVDAISEENLDPLLLARESKDENIALICALFAYGNVNQIVKFLRSIDFNDLNSDPKLIEKKYKKHYYRFQKGEDIISLLIALRKLKDKDSLKELFLNGYRKEQSVLEGLDSLINEILNNSPAEETRGYNFLVGKPPVSQKSNSPLKRWNMYLRWMVRDDNIDLGLWKDVYSKDLIIPLDTHIFKVSKKLGLLTRKSYDLKAALLLTEKLKEFDKDDPVKYDFALYRIGQNKEIYKLIKT